MEDIHIPPQKKSKFNHSFDNILRNTSLLGSIKVFSILMSIIKNKIIALFLGSWGFGLVDIYSRTIEVVSNASNMGMAFSAVRRLAELESRGERIAVEQYIKVVRSWVLITAILGIIICIGLSPYLSNWTFGDKHTTKGFILLSPMVGFLTLTGGELAILKGLHRLKSVAWVNALGAFLSVIISIPIYVFWGIHGIIPVLLLNSLALLLLNGYYSCRQYPYRLGLGSISLLKRGNSMVLLGVSYVFAGLVGSGSEMMIRAFLVRTSGLKMAGLYAAGLTVTVSYARLIFSAMDADYFPKLSALGNDTNLRNTLINRQIDVLVMLVTPLLILFGLAASWIIKVLYSQEFLEATPMVVCSLSYMFFKAVYSPIAYLALSKGDSLLYLIMESIYAVIFVSAVIVGYHLYGLKGAGIGLSIANFIDLCTIGCTYHFRYHFNFISSTLNRTSLQFILLIISVITLMLGESFFHIGTGIVCLCLSIYSSYQLLKRESQFMSKLSNFKEKYLLKKKNYKDKL